MGSIRRLLDGLYLVAGYFAAACMVALLVVIVLQMAARWTGVQFPGSTDYAGYLMASSSFLAFSHALNAGAHIRVGLMLNALGRWRWIGEVWCFGIGATAASYVAWHAVKLVYWSKKLGDISQGQDETALWIPQAPFAFGAVLFAICMIDNLLTLLATRRDNIKLIAGTPVE